MDTFHAAAYSVNILHEHNIVIQTRKFTSVATLLIEHFLHLSHCNAVLGPGSSLFVLLCGLLPSGAGPWVVGLSSLRHFLEEP